MQRIWFPSIAATPCTKPYSPLSSLDHTRCNELQLVHPYNEVDNRFEIGGLSHYATTYYKVLGTSFVLEMLSINSLSKWLTDDSLRLTLTHTLVFISYIQPVSQFILLPLY